MARGTKVMKTGREIRADAAALLATVEKLVNAAKKKKAAKMATKPPAAHAPQPVAAPKPKSRGGRLIQMEREVAAAKPRDKRLLWSDMSK
jgi:hypothetical protein